MEAFYPLHVRLCANCFWFNCHRAKPERFFRLCLFSSYSDSWLDHAKAYVDAASKILAQPRQPCGGAGQQRRLPCFSICRPGIPVLGIELRRTSPKRQSRKESHRVQFSARNRSRPDWRAFGPISSSATTSGACSRPERLREWNQDPAAGTRGRDAQFPH
jgi:hypothetical protein